MSINFNIKLAFFITFNLNSDESKFKKMRFLASGDPIDDLIAEVVVDNVQEPSRTVVLPLTNAVLTIDKIGKINFSVTLFDKDDKIISEKKIKQSLEVLIEESK